MIVLSTIVIISLWAIAVVGFGAALVFGEGK